MTNRPPHPARFAASASDFVPRALNRQENDRLIRAEMSKAVVITQENLPAVLRSRPNFWKTIYKICQEVGGSPVYLAGVVYAETTFKTPNAVVSKQGKSTLEVRGFGQFSEAAWDEVAASTTFQDAWRNLTGSSRIPGWGTSPTASLLAIEVRRQMDAEKYRSTLERNPLINYQASYLSHMLSDETVWKFLKEEPMKDNPDKLEKTFVTLERERGFLFENELTQLNWVKYKDALQLFSQALPKGLTELQVALAKKE